MKLRFNPVAVEEWSRTEQFLVREVGERVADDFMSCVNAALDALERDEAFSQKYARNPLYRRVKVATFDYEVVYEARTANGEHEAYIWAIAYLGRDPGYWEERLERR
jgi:hypothetical protein